MHTTSIMLFTRDLRVHDNPALAAAVAAGDRVVPLFVLDDRILGGGSTGPNRVRFLLDSLEDLGEALRGLGAGLVVRRGDPVAQVRELARQVGASSLHVADDVTRHAARRRRGLADVCRDLGIPLEVHPGHTVVPHDRLRTTTGSHYEVFTPYWRRWAEAPRRAVLGPPSGLRLPEGLDPDQVPPLGDLVTGPTSPELQRGGETRGRSLVEGWFARGIASYDEARDALADDGTSRLSAHLHLGTVSATEVADRVDLRRRGHGAFLRQLAWRDFNHQLLAAFPELPRVDYRPRGDDWHDDPDAVCAWQEGRTGYPVVDAAMRQLRREGFMHNRARMIVASFLTKHLYVDWRVGYAHFQDWLVDGDVANNAAQWQWVAGTGTDPRPNRVLNPVAQSRRHDARGEYIRRYVAELADVGAEAVHAPWDTRGARAASTDYPAPIVEHGGARRRFLERRSS